MVKDAFTTVLLMTHSSDGIPKIDTENGTDALLDFILPERGGGLWKKGDLGLDGNIYFIPYKDRRILKVDPCNDILEIASLAYSILGQFLVSMDVSMEFLVIPTRFSSVT